MTEDVELTVVTMVFDAAEPDRLVSVLAKYVVLSRGHRGCQGGCVGFAARPPFPLAESYTQLTPSSDEALFSLHMDSGSTLSEL